MINFLSTDLIQITTEKSTSNYKIVSCGHQGNGKSKFGDPIWETIWKLEGVDESNLGKSIEISESRMLEGQRQGNLKVIGKFEPKKATIYK
jgi:hypothetical protein